MNEGAKLSSKHPMYPEMFTKHLSKMNVVSGIMIFVRKIRPVAIQDGCTTKTDRKAHDGGEDGGDYSRKD